MALHVIAGLPGSGKTTCLYETIFRTAEAGSRQYLFVPEQASLKAQKEMTELHPEHCVLQCDILSLKRLAFRLTGELGAKLPGILQDTGKGMLLKRVLMHHRDQLTFYRGKERRKGFVSQVRSMISELSQYTTTPEQLELFAGQCEDRTLSGKVKDLSVIYRLFREALADTYLTEEELAKAMIPLVRESRRLRNSDLYFDGFTGFTPSQYGLLQELFSTAREVYVTVTIDEANWQTPEDSIFEMSRSTVKTLYALARDAGQEIAPVQFTTGQFGAKAICHLRSALFRRRPAVFSEAPASIVMRSLVSLEEEARYVTGTIVRLVQREGVRYGQIGIILGDVLSMAPILVPYLERAGIPYFLDYKTDVWNNLLVDYCRCGLRIVAERYRTDAVIHFLKNPLSGFTMEEAALLENYVLALGVRGKQSFSKPFYRKSKAKRIPLPEQMEPLRERLMGRLSVLEEGFGAGKSVTEHLTALYHFLAEPGVTSCLHVFLEQLHEQEPAEWARIEKEYEQIPGALTGLMEQMHELLGELVMPVSEFVQVWDAGLEELKLGVIPPRRDCVLLGDVHRSRIDHVDSLFFMGVNEGIVPGFSDNRSLLNDRERERLQAEEIVLAKTGKDKVSVEEFYCYLTMSKPYRRLYLTYSRNGGEGGTRQPSYVCNHVRRLFPLLTVGFGESDDLYGKIAPDCGRKLLIDAVRLRHKGGGNAESRAVLAYFGEEEQLFGSLMTPKQLRLAAAGGEKTTGIGREKAGELYGANIQGSVSKMEMHAKCEYQFFLRYGLGLMSREQYSILPTDIGNVAHGALCQISRVLKESGARWSGLSEAQQKQLVSEALQQELNGQTTELFECDNRSRYQLAVLQEQLLTSLDFFSSQEEEGGFVPEEFETSFQYRDRHLLLSGIIDRIDRAKAEDRVYTKLIDYKTGKKEFSLEEVVDGTSIQLPVYLRQQMREHPEYVTMAGLYLHIDDPYVVGSPEEAKALRSSLMRPHGLVQENADGLALLDGQLFGEDGAMKRPYSSKTLPITVKRDGKYDAKTELYPKEQWEAILAYTEQALVERAERILSGALRLEPLAQKQYSACSYCEYAGICGFDPTLPHCHYRHSAVKSRQEALAVIGQWREEQEENTKTKGEQTNG